jgi:hypothetical protein
LEKTQRGVNQRKNAFWSRHICHRQDGTALIFGLYCASLEKRDGNLNLIDAFQICIFPMLEGKGLPLFDAIQDRTMFRLVRTKALGSGAVVLCDEPLRPQHLLLGLLNFERRLASFRQP